MPFAAQSWIAETLMHFSPAWPQIGGTQESKSWAQSQIQISRTHIAGCTDTLSEGIPSGPVVPNIQESRHTRTDVLTMPWLYMRIMYIMLNYGPIA